VYCWKTLLRYKFSALVSWKNNVVLWTIEYTHSTSLPSLSLSVWLSSLFLAFSLFCISFVNDILVLSTVYIDYMNKRIRKRNALLEFLTEILNIISLEQLWENDFLDYFKSGTICLIKTKSQVEIKTNCQHNWREFLFVRCWQSFFVFVDQVHVLWSPSCHEYTPCQHQRLLRPHNCRHVRRLR